MPNAEFDLYRLARAVHLDAERTGYGSTYWVSGGEVDHLVNLAADAGPECDCEDHRRGVAQCKHILRARMAEGHAEVLNRLRFFIPMPGARKRQVAKV